MTQRPDLTDTQALNRHRMRVTEGCMFLHETVADEFDDRLNVVNRSFTDAGIVTGHPRFWAHHMPRAVVTPDQETLALVPDSLDLVVHALGLHWANDLVGQLVQMRRALKPDGLMLAGFFAGRTLHELRTCLAEAEAALTGGLSPRVAPMGELRDLGGLLQRAGFALPVADIQTLNVEYADMWQLMHDLRAMGETNALATRPRRFSKSALFERAADLYAQHFSTAAGRVTATFEIVYLTGWAPSAAQQKPLRPGSASQRLADALGTHETSLGD